MKLAIDLQACITDSRYRGIGRYVRGLYQGLLNKCPHEHEMVTFLDAICPNRLREIIHTLRADHLDFVSLGKYYYPHHADVTDFSQAHQTCAGLMKTKAMDAVCPDISLVTTFFETGTPYSTGFDVNGSEAKKAVIAYDLIPYLFPDHYLAHDQRVKAWYYAKLEQFKKFDLFLAISEATKTDLVSHLGIDEHKIAVIDAGLDQSLFESSSEDMPKELKTKGIKAPFILMVGNGDWRKNCLGALDAFADLPKAIRKKHQLVFTSVGSDVLNALKGSHRHVAQQVIIIGHVSDIALSWLYKECYLFFFPSLYEGYGLPVLEAMAAGAPVICSSLSSLPEVVHTDLCLFDPQDTHQTTHTLAQALTEKAFRQKLLNGAVEHARSFTWARTAKLAWEALETLSLAKPRGGTKLLWSHEQVKTIADVCMETNSEDQILKSLHIAQHPMRKRVLVDITNVVDTGSKTGIQRVARCYADGLLALSAQDENFEVLTVKREGRQLVEVVRQVDHHDEYWQQEQAVAILPGDCLYIPDSCWYDPEDYDDIYQQIRESGGEIIWTLFDLIPLRHPKFCVDAMQPFFRTWLHHTIKNTDGFICISDSVRLDLEDYFDEHPELVEKRRPWTRFVHLGSDISDATSEQKSMVLNEIGLNDKTYFLVVGTIEPRKNHGIIIDAMERLWKKHEDIHLVFVGKEGWNTKKLIKRIHSHPKYEKTFHWFSKADDAELVSLMSSCKALIQASYAEGFGLPIIEAAYQNTPVILSDIPVFREISGEHDFYFSPSDAMNLYQVMKAVLHTRERQLTQNIHCMSWKDSTAQVSNILNFRTQ